MRPVNLRGIVIANKSLTTEQRNGLYKVWGIEPKPKELITLESFLKECDAQAPYQPGWVTEIVGK
jgi:hypothetical protein